MSNLQNLNELNQMILSGQILDAFEKFYDDNVVMQENSQEPRVGKDVNREYEKQFVSNVEEFHSAEVLSTAENGDTTMAEWHMDITFKGGQRQQLNQAAVQTWKDGKIIKERFYHGE
ncbi:nuclear transport factor 2 family protein [Fulvivirgaceae bacterium BMA10]|uniref:Nuclear transport factor 2 family protein n=1 Tax=Splendidivirga corallicola TaxID=3051826 RepID=A0ABT8KM64_9BACT|nr:nuclear transport factor 2 family protein [Fulvivirgaceae bacterium BMA10]